MQTKILIGILLVISLIIGIGIVFAHGTGSTDENEMVKMMGNMMSNGIMDDRNMGMMGNESSMTEMHEMMEEMMNDDEMREEMREHMESCPMMKRFNSQE